MIENYSNLKTLPSFIHNSADNFPNKLALVFEEEKLTFSELSLKIKQLRSFFIKNTIKQDRVVLFFNNSINYLLTYFSVMDAACVSVPIETSTKDELLISKIKSIMPKLIIVQNDVYLKRLQELLPAVDIRTFDESLFEERIVKREYSEEDVSTLLFTTGTTKTPKIVEIRHSNVVHTSKDIISYLHINSDNVDCLGLPLTHSFGLGAVHTQMLVGGTSIIFRNFLNVPKFLNMFIEREANSFRAPPVIIDWMVNKFSDKLKKAEGKIDFIVIDSAPMNPKLTKKLLEILPSTNSYMYYGLTEASRSTFIHYNKNLERLSSVGLPRPGVQIKLVSEGKQVVEPFVDGELVIKSKSVVEGYLNEEETNNSFKEEWFFSKDIGYKDEDGYLFIKGRSDDQINVLGLKVYPVEVEEIINKLDVVKESACIPGLKDDQVFVKAFVVSEEDITQEQVKIHCRKYLEEYKVPKEVIFLKELPKNWAGKIRRSLLK